MTKKIRELLKFVGDQWYAELTGCGHYRFINAKTGQRFYSPSTSCSRRGEKNLRALIRRLERQQVN